MFIVNLLHMNEQSRKALKIDYLRALGEYLNQISLCFYGIYGINTAEPTISRFSRDWCARPTSESGKVCCSESLI